MTVRLLIQQSVEAKLKLPNDEVLHVSHGVVVFVCMLQGVSEEKVSKAVSTILKVKLSEELEKDEDDDGEEKKGNKRQSAKDIKRDILVIPQATLGGKLKGNSVQYHQNIKPEEGEKYFHQFCDQLQLLHSECNVKRGVYGARQVLSMETNGPFSHVFDI